MLPWTSMFLTILMLGSFIAMSSSSWFMAWMGLEINILAFLTLALSDKTPRNSEAALKYFLIQALSSAILISSAFISSAMFSFLDSSNTFSLTILLSLLIKLGGAPFHLWVPQVAEGMSWINNMLTLTLQKLAPFVLIMPYIDTLSSKTILMFSIILSTILGAIKGLNQTSTRKIFAFSSINHTGWMLMAIFSSISIWVCYYTLYSLMVVILLVVCAQKNITSLSSTNFSLTSKEQIPFFISLLSFAGLPPLTGFAPKWMIIVSMSHNSMIILIVMVLSSLITLVFYMRLMVSSLMMNGSTMNNLNSNNSKLSLAMMFNLSGLLLFPLVLCF